MKLSTKSTLRLINEYLINSNEITKNIAVTQINLLNNTCLLELKSNYIYKVFFTLIYINDIKKAYLDIQGKKTKFNILYSLSHYNYFIYANSNYICTDDTYYSKQECNHKKNNALKILRNRIDFYNLIKG